MYDVEPDGAFILVT